MAWTTPLTRATGDLVTASSWNQDVRDNLQFLHDNRQEELDYKQIIADATTTATTEGTSTSIITANSITYDGTKNRVEFWAPSVHGDGTAGSITLVIYRDTTVLGRAVTSFSGANAYDRSIICFDTPASGAHTYKVFGFVPSGTGTVEAGAGGAGNKLPAFLRVTRA